MRRIIRAGWAVTIVLSAIAATPPLVVSADPAVTGYPSILSVAGDSISTAFNASPSDGFDDPPHSWATGTADAVNSHYRRILAGNPGISGRNPNCAMNGARMVDLPGGLACAAGPRAEYVAILMGGNDVCAPTEEAMTPVADFASQFRSALATYTPGSPDVRIFVASIPDIYQLWSLFHEDPNAVAVWSTYGICPSMLAAPQSLAQADVDRRARVRQRNTDYNAQLAAVCAEFVHCRFDGKAVFNTVITPVDVAIDYFHPSIPGQALLAAVTWAATFDFTDGVPPSASATASESAGGHLVSLSATDNIAVSGLEHRVGTGAYQRHVGAVLVLYGSTITYRAVDVNGNSSATSSFTSTVGVPVLSPAASRPAGAVALSWSASPSAASNTVTYRVLRSTAGAGAYTVVADRVVGLEHTDTPAADGSYDYTVEAVVGTSVSAPSNVAAGLSDRSAPTAAQLTAATGTTTGSARLSWTVASDAGTGVSSYTVRYVQANSCPAASAASYPQGYAAGNVTWATITGLSSGKRYCFYVSATDGAGNVGSASNVAAAKAK